MSFHLFQKKIATLPGIFLVILLTACQTGADWKAQIPLNSTVQTGTLSNGLKYYILENDQPRNKAELRLIVDAGSILEEDDQQGLAHFLEHMAFNGTQLYPKNELISFLQDIGVEFGPDLNAYTGFDETVYRLSLPTDKEGTLQTGMEILAQWAFHINLETEDVHSERGVILEERRLKRDANQRIVDKLLPLLLKDSRYPTRIPIGNEHSIKTAEVEPLQRFYDDWYRPDLMAVVAVGDFSATEVEQYIHQFFSDAPNPSREKPERTRYDVPFQNEIRFAFESDPEMLNSWVEIFHRYRANQASTGNVFRAVLIDRLFYTMVNQRLDTIAQQEDAPFIAAHADSRSYTRNTSHDRITAQSSPAELEQTLKGIFTEYERISRYGFLKSELNRAVKSLYSSAKSDWQNRDNRQHLGFTNALIDYHLEKMALPSAKWHWNQIQRHLPRIRLKDFDNLMYELEMNNDYVILITGPEEIEGYRFGLDRVMEIRREATNTPLEPWVDSVANTELIQAAPTPGAIRSETYNDEAGIHHWVLSNGATVYIKPTDFEAGKVLFSAFSPGGFSQVSDQDYVSAAMATTAVHISGLGDLSKTELDNAVKGKNMGLTISISEAQEGFKGHASPEDLETLFQLVHLYFTSVRGDQAAWDSYSEQLVASIENNTKDPEVQYSRKLDQVLYDGNPRGIRTHRAQDIPNVDLQKSIDIFRQRFSNAADFTFILVGAVDLEQIRELCKTWIAGLAATQERETRKDVGLDYFRGQKREEIRVGIDTTPWVTMIWTGNSPWTYDNFYNLKSLSAALDIILLEEVREKASGTYSISTDYGLSGLPDKDYLFAIQFSADAPRVDELINIVNESIANLKENGPAAQYITKVAENQRVQYRENLESNEWWLNQINFLLHHSLGWEYATEKNRWYNALTAADIQTAANKYLNSENYAEIILFPGNFE